MELEYLDVRSNILRPPKQSIDLSFDNVQYSVSAAIFSNKKKKVLKGVSGVFKSGELTAIMGPSGAGKSSLLNVLSGFISQGVEGSLYANDHRLDAKKSSIKNHLAYIMQDDYLNPFFTVKETMEQSAHLKIGNIINRKSKHLLVEDILESMAMRETMNVRCSRLSGGQKRRLNICLELINNPSILYLDEPTSGLDSSSSSLLINMLKGLAKSGRTIICTIHQPSAGLFALFDHLYLMANGETVYQGTPANIHRFLDSVGLACPHFHNPADFVMDVICGEFGNVTQKLISISNNNDWRKNYAESDAKADKEYKTVVHKIAITHQNDDITPSEWSRYRLLLKRLVILLHRDWMISYFRALVHISLGLLIGLMHKDFGNDGARVVNNIYLLFFVYIYTNFISLMSACLKFPSEIQVVKKEHFNNWYKFSTYFSALITVQLPVQVFFQGMFTVIVYYLSGQFLEWERFGLFFTVTAFNSCISELIGLMMGTSTNPVNGVFVSSVIIAVFVLLSGFLVFINDMPRVLGMVTFISFSRYLFEILIVSQYGLGRGKLDCPKETLYCHFRNPEVIINEIVGLDESNLWKNIGTLSGYLLLVGLLAFFIIRHRLKTFSDK